MQIRDLSIDNVVVCERGTTASQAASLMRHRHVGDIVIVDEIGASSIPLGVVTDRDLTVKVLALGRNPAQTLMGTLINGPTVSANELDDVSTAVERMRSNGVRRLPVVDRAGRLVGIVSLTDLLQAMIKNAHDAVDVMARSRIVEQQSRP
jgi:CBS domain-containing protein